jgi:hypothetical protein
LLRRILVEIGPSRHFAAMQWLVGFRCEAASRKSSVRTTLERFRLTCQPTLFAGRHLALD